MNPIPSQESVVGFPCRDGSTGVLFFKDASGQFSADIYPGDLFQSTYYPATERNGWVEEVAVRSPMYKGQSWRAFKVSDPEFPSEYWQCQSIAIEREDKDPFVAIAMVMEATI